MAVNYYGTHRGKVAACAELSAFQVGNDIENAGGLVTVDVEDKTMEADLHTFDGRRLA